MLFFDFKQQFSQYPLFSTIEIEKRYPGFNKINLLSWQKKGYLQKIRNGWYCFTDTKIDEAVLFCMANNIYKPSYVSLEAALYYYGIIPEAAFIVSSISTSKTQAFNSEPGRFSYTNIKTSCFFGYKLVQNQNFTFKIADIEKALLDYLYINYSIKNIEDIKSLRLNKQLLQEKLNLQKLVEYALLYNSKTTLKKIETLKCFLDAY